MSTLIREKEYRSSTGRVLVSPEHSILHPVYALFFAVSAMSVLWQNGHPGMTLALLLLIPVFAAGAYIPFRFIPPFLRLIAGIIVLASALVWTRFRLMQNVPLDKIAAEFLCISALAFLGGGRRANYRYLLGISLLMLIYGGLIPRLFFLSLFSIAFAVLLILCAGHRTESLAAAKEPLRGHIPKRIFAVLLLMQGVIFAALFWYSFSAFPTRPATGRGLFEVSFHTDKERASAKNIREWLKPPEKKRPASEKGSIEMKNAGKASTVSDSGNLLAALQNAKSRSSVEGDGGAAPPSDELIFECSMPARLYHAANFYDTYNGVKWSVTLPKQGMLFNYLSPIPENIFEVNYRLHRLISGKLYAPYRSSCFIAEGDQAVLIRNNFRGFGAELPTGQNIMLPFEYKVTVSLPSPENDLWKGESSERLLNTLELAQPEPPEKNPFFMNRFFRGRRRFFRAPPSDYEKQGISIMDGLTHYHLRGECLNGFMLPSPSGGVSVSRVKCRVWKARLAYRPVRNEVPLRYKRSFPPRSRKPSLTANKLRFTKTADPIRPQRTAVLTRPAVLNCWTESLPRTHYLKLPKRISGRLKQLTRSIIAGKKGSYEKGTALRDWLRTRLKYRQFAGKVPRKREPVDWFVFEEKEGHCEYFASSLAVMARIAGIPSRVVIGFSPGDYNTLTGLFEVKGYHAHAWTQLFMEGAGWLTFDATPPSSVPAKTTPAGIGKFRDPFGDEWKIMPPEMTSEIRKMTAKRIAEAKAEETKQNQEEEGDLLEELAQTQEKFTETFRQQFRSADEQKKGGSVQRKNSLVETIRQFFRRTGAQISGYWSLAFGFLMEHKAVTGVLLLLAASLFIMGKILLSWLSARRLIAAYRTHALAAEKAFAGREWGKSVRENYLAWRFLLLLSGFRRHRNEELFEFLDSIQKQSPEYGAVSEIIFTAFYVLEYSGREPSESCALKVKETLFRGKLLTEKSIHARISAGTVTPASSAE